MISEKEPLLPIINEKIENNKRHWTYDVEVGPRYEDNKWWWFLVILLRIFIFAVAFISAMTSGNYFIWCLNIQNTAFDCIFTILYIQIVWPLILLLLSFVFGQLNYFYLVVCRCFIYEFILPKEYILNRIAAEAETLSS
ncbi:hypothetical protein BJ944DRAFT_229976 [Cunninghamella echinulata]|nr:hypothetical protein BJ944DRAFT_229976 [Cunninghamella echinulata]